MQGPPGFSQPPLSSSPLLHPPPPPPLQPQQGNSQRQPYKTGAGADAGRLPVLSGFVHSQQPDVQSMAQQASGEIGLQILQARQPRRHQASHDSAGLVTVDDSGWDHNLSRYNPDAGTEASNRGFELQRAQQQQAEAGNRSHIQVSASGAPAQRVQHMAGPSFKLAGNGLPAQRPAAGPSLEGASSGSSAQHAGQTQQAAVTGLFQRLQVDPSRQHQHTSQVSPAPFQGDPREAASIVEHSPQVNQPRLTNRPKLGFPTQLPSNPCEPHKHTQLPAYPEAANHPKQGDTWDAPSTSQSLPNRPEAQGVYALPADWHDFMSNGPHDWHGDATYSCPSDAAERGGQPTAYQQGRDQTHLGVTGSALSGNAPPGIFQHSQAGTKAHAGCICCMG